MAHGKVEKTNAARLLDRAKINYELVPYEVDEEHLAAFAGRHEKALPDLYPLFGRGASVHLYQRRRPGPATENRPGRADSIRRGDRG